MAAMVDMMSSINKTKQSAELLHTMRCQSLEKLIGFLGATTGVLQQYQGLENFDPAALKAGEMEALTSKLGRFSECRGAEVLGYLLDEERKIEEIQSEMSRFLGALATDSGVMSAVKGRGVAAVDAHAEAQAMAQEAARELDSAVQGSKGELVGQLRKIYDRKLRVFVHEQYEVPDALKERVDEFVACVYDTLVGASQSNKPLHLLATLDEGLRNGHIINACPVTCIPFGPDPPCVPRAYPCGHTVASSALERSSNPRACPLCGAVSETNEMPHVDSAALARAVASRPSQVPAEEPCPTTPAPAPARQHQATGLRTPMASPELTIPPYETPSMYAKPAPVRLAKPAVVVATAPEAVVPSPHPEQLTRVKSVMPEREFEAPAAPTQAEIIELPSATEFDAGADAFMPSPHLARLDTRRTASSPREAPVAENSYAKAAALVNATVREPRTKKNGKSAPRTPEPTENDHAPPTVSRERASSLRSKVSCVRDTAPVESGIMDATELVNHPSRPKSSRRRTAGEGNSSSGMFDDSTALIHAVSASPAKRLQERSAELSAPLPVRSPKMLTPERSPKPRAAPESASKTRTPERSPKTRTPERSPKTTVAPNRTSAPLTPMSNGAYHRSMPVMPPAHLALAALDSVRVYLEPRPKLPSDLSAVTHLASWSQTALKTHDSIKALANALPAMPHLKRVILVESRIGDEGMYPLSAALPALKELKELRLCYNHISDEGVGELVGALPQLPSLEWLDLSGNDVGEDGAEQLASVLPALRRMRKLSLWNNDVGLVGAQALEGYSMVKF